MSINNLFFTERVVSAGLTLRPDDLRGPFQPEGFYDSVTSYKIQLIGFCRW